MKAKIFVLTVIFVLSSLISACNNEKVANGILSVPMGTSKVESTITQVLQDTCPKVGDRCKLIGE